MAPVAGVLNKDVNKPPGSGNGFLEDITLSEDISMEEPSGSTLKEQDHSKALDRLSSVISLIRELVRDAAAALIFHFSVLINVLFLFLTLLN